MAVENSLSMKSISLLSAFFAFCVVLTSTGELSTPEDKARENLQKLALANNELAFNLLRNLPSGSSGNVFFSPFSISTAFGMLFHGTRGSTAEELREALGYKKADLPNYLVHDTFNHFLREVLRSEDSSAGYILKAVNAVLVDKGLELHKDYRNDVQELYRAAVRDVDFKRETPRVVEETNSWVREKTDGKIEKLLEELDPSAVFVLVNAVYFLGNWETQFELERTRDEIFYNNGLESDGRKIPLMHITYPFPFAAVDNFQVLELPYKGKNVSMVIFLPNRRDGLKDLEESLTPEKLADVQRRLFRTEVDVSFPKFKLQFQKEISKQVRDLGARQIFRAGANFSGMTHRRNVVVSQVFHKAVIEVNEVGSEAAAVTGISFGITSEIETPKFKVYHPFLFTIVEKGSKSNMILFLGRVNNL